MTFNWERQSLIADAIEIDFSKKLPGGACAASHAGETATVINDVPWQATSDAPWLSATANGLTGGDVVLTANPAGLAAGNCIARR